MLVGMTEPTSKEHRQQHISNWKASGLSMAEYSRQNGISPGFLSTWVRRSKEKEVGHRNGGFVELPLSLPGNRKSNGVTLQIKVDEAGHLQLQITLA